MPHSQRFPRVHRLTKSSDFERVYRTGKLIHNEHVRIYVLVQERDAPPRLGLSVTRRLGKASVRNRLKRWIREWFRTRQSQLDAFEIVVQPKPPAAQLDHKALLKSLENLVAPVRPNE